MFGINTRRFPLKLSIMILGILLISTSSTHAAVKDSDADGLTDTAETTLYLTDPTNPDTDNDRISDGDEVLGGTNPIRPDIVSHTLERDTSPDASLAWYVGRASGILAFILLTIVVINGLLMSTRLAFRFLPPALNYEMHRFFSWMALLAVIGHALSFFFDAFFHLTLSEALIPFTLDRNFSSYLGYDLRFAIGIGTIALYGIGALVISSELKGHGVSLKKWRILHYCSFLTYILFLMHGFLAGTDSTEWWMIWFYSLSAFLVFGLTGIRIFLAIQKKKGITPLSSETP